MRRIVFWLAIGLGVFLSAAIAFVMLGQTSPRAIPTKVPGFHEMHVAVPHREEDLSVYVWYPTEALGEPELVAQNALFYGFHAYRDARPLAEAAPVVVISHGSGGNGRQLGWIARELATNGFIVVATDHPGTTSGDSDPFQTIKVWERPQDLTALLDLLSYNPPLGLRTDMNRVGALGFSLGGHSVLSLSGLRVSKAMFIDYCDENRGKIDCGWMQDAGVDFNTIDQSKYERSNRDGRVTSVVAVDPALPRAVPIGGTDELKAATLVINLGETEEVPAAMRADDLATRIQNAEYKAIKGAWHFSFLAECSPMGFAIIGIASPENICSDWGLRNRGKVHAELAPIIVNHFLKSLRN